MKPSLVPMLRSPLNNTAFVLGATAQSGPEILEGELVDQAGNRFPIRNGVPDFSLLTPTDAHDSATFSFKWKRIGRSYGVEEKTRSRRQNWYLERFGFGSMDSLIQLLNQKRHVLDAGCGSGVDSEMFVKSRATVIAVDLSEEAAHATWKNLGHFPNIHVLRADITRLPFPSGFFDYISCDQVMHHTPNTEATFHALAQKLSGDGHFATYVYKKKAPLREFADDLLRTAMTNMTAEECYEHCVGLTALGKALSDLHTNVEIPNDVPLLGIKAGRYDVQRFIYWNVVKCFWNDDYDFETNVMINFDWYHPRFAWRHTEEELSAWYHAERIEIESLSDVESGIAVLGRRRA